MAENHAALTDQEARQVLEDYRTNKARDAEAQALRLETVARSLAETAQKRPHDEQVKVAARVRAEEAGVARKRADILLERVGITRADLAGVLVNQLRDELRGLEIDEIRCQEEAAAPDAYATTDDEREAIARRGVEATTAAESMRRTVGELIALRDAAEDDAPDE